MAELISIIVPVYNGEKFIADMLMSLKKQTYKHMEFIIVDDGSSDDTYNIVSRFAENDNRFKILQQENQGVSAARNNGMKHAQGTIIGFADADDICDDRQYEKMYAAMIAEDAEVSICSLQFDYPDRCVLQHGDYQLGKKICFGREQAIGEMFEGRAFSGHLHNKLFKREVLKNLRLADDVAICEDTLFCTNVLMNCSRIVYLAEPLYHYYIRSTSAYHQQDFDKLYTAHVSYQRMEQILKESRMTEQTMQCFYSAFFTIDLMLMQRAFEMGLTKDIRSRVIKCNLRRCYKMFAQIVGYRRKFIYWIAAYIPQLYRFLRNAFADK